MRTISLRQDEVNCTLTKPKSLRGKRNGEWLQRTPQVLSENRWLLARYCDDLGLSYVCALGMICDTFPGQCLSLT